VRRLIILPVSDKRAAARFAGLSLACVPFWLAATLQPQRGRVMTKKSAKRANSFDHHISARAAAKRKELGFSQGDVAKAVGITFQQVQKYEKATNRISAGRLWQMAKFFKVPIDYFFDGLK
jgi:DNA-binding XRE family transcriptional regulator